MLGSSTTSTREDASLSFEYHAAEAEALIGSEEIRESDEIRDGIFVLDENPTGLDLIRLKLSTFIRAYSVLLLQVILGVFLASCPIPRYFLIYPLRIILITFNVTLIIFPLSRPYRRSVHRRNQIIRTLVAYFGFYLSIYALIGASQEVHIELRWQSLLWYRSSTSYTLGYLGRCILTLMGYYIQVSAGLHSRRCILGSYLLSIVSVFADMPTTIFDLARGRPRW
ncbi:hypothetical protein BX600DRAFT_248155 [Xylariales sp. PMI_506]|nr:hypothetical protein BX600DRAFT_248155 [Xylariales sp. PMI_506]